MSAKRKHRSTNEYLKYLKGELSAEERYSFERDLEADPFEMEAMEGMENIPAEEAEEDLLSLHASFTKRLKSKEKAYIIQHCCRHCLHINCRDRFFNIYNINPKTAEESILKDESFLHEDLPGREEARGRASWTLEIKFKRKLRLLQKQEPDKLRSFTRKRLCRKQGL